MQQQVKENTKEALEAQTDKLSTLKELLFGEEKQQYDHRFEDLDEKTDQRFEKQLNMILDLESRMNQKIDDLQAQYDEKISALKTDLNQSIDLLSNEKLDKKKMADLLTTMASNLN